MLSSELLYWQLFFLYHTFFVFLRLIFIRRTASIRLRTLSAHKILNIIPLILVRSISKEILSEFCTEEYKIGQYWVLWSEMRHRVVWDGWCWRKREKTPNDHDLCRLNDAHFVLLMGINRNKPLKREYMPTLKELFRVWDDMIIEKSPIRHINQKAVRPWKITQNTGSMRWSEFKIYDISYDFDMLFGPYKNKTP